ncbi:hypothetical protein CEXT_431541 [Caerostris extrusa]|uniref:Uncharacterized protein n=1 Tax=Caerostris extrusa TaxID=172846 RepID=A0AAV4QJP2_CAEEX|nr:hypothetical protein CEXT_431541 [Caerostris extrusa]
MRSNTQNPAMRHFIVGIEVGKATLAPCLDGSVKEEKIVPAYLESADLAVERTEHRLPEEYLVQNKNSKWNIRLPEEHELENDKPKYCEALTVVIFLDGTPVSTVTGVNPQMKPVIQKGALT